VAGQAAGWTGREKQAKDQGACDQVGVGTGDGDIQVYDRGWTSGSDGETEWGKKHGTSKKRGGSKKRGKKSNNCTT